jgi:hypothetical protein
MFRSAMEVASPAPAPDGTASATGWRRQVLAALLLVGLVLGTFGQTVGHGWVNLDDDIHVTANPSLNPVTLAGLRRLWAAPYQNLYAPLAYTLFACETQASRSWFGGDATAPPDARLFHAVSVVLHAANVLLVWRLLHRLSPGDIWPATAGAALFAIHPLQVESVGWISEQRGLLAATCSLAAMGLHLGGEQMERGTGRGRLRHVAALGLFGLALLAKPQAVTVPLLLLLLDVVGRGRPLRPVAIELLPWFVLAGVVSFVTKLLQPAVYTDYVAPWLRPLVAGDALLFYGSKLLWPLHLCIDYARTPQVVLASVPACVAALAAWLAVAVALLLPRLGRWRLVPALSVVSLLPVLGFTPFLFQDFSTVADRYLYVAMLGPSLALTWGYAWTLERPSQRAVSAAMAVILVLCAWGSFLQARVWRSSLTLCEHAVRVEPKTFLGNCNLGAALIDAGKPGEAIDFLRRAVSIGPDHPDAHLSLAIALDQVNRLDEAAKFYGNVLMLYPQHAEAHNYLGVIHARQGRVAQAAQHFRAAVTIKPAYHDAQRNLDRAEAIVTGSPAAR